MDIVLRNKIERNFKIIDGNIDSAKPKALIKSLPRFMDIVKLCHVKRFPFKEIF